MATDMHLVSSIDAKKKFCNFKQDLGLQIFIENTKQISGPFAENDVPQIWIS